MKWKKKKTTKEKRKHFLTLEKNVYICYVYDF